MRSLTEKQLKCPACGSKNPSDNERCEICGSLLRLTDEEKHILYNLRRISKVGRSRAEDIINAGFSKVSELERDDVDDFSSIDGIGPSIAENIMEFLEDAKDEEGKLRLCRGCNHLIGENLEECPECDRSKEEESSRSKPEKPEEKKARRCSLCGSPLKDVEMICPVCGKSLRDDSLRASKEEKTGSKKDVEREIHDKEAPTEKGAKLGKGEVEDIVQEIKRLESDIDEGRKDEIEEETEEESFEEIAAEIEKGKKYEIEEKETNKEHHEAYPGELQEDQERIRNVLRKVKDHEWIEIKEIKERFKRLLSHEKKGKYDEAMDLAIELLLDVKDLERLQQDLDEAEKMKKDLSEEESKKELSKKMERIKKKCGDGKYQDALEISNNLTDFTQEDQKKRMKRLFEKKLKKTQKNIKVARQTQLDLDVIKTKIRRSIESERSGNIKKGLDLLEETLNRLEDLFVFSLKLEEARGKLSEIREKGGETVDLSRRLKKLKDLADDGNFNEARNGITSLIRDIDERKGSERAAEEEKEEIESGEDDTENDEIDDHVDSMKEKVQKGNEEPRVKKRKVHREN
ncbi:MAG: hypothetical protein KGY76_06190 [Candidatus Thermoplasmatota archaeon]|nr:hypothetical protein [Candidatus Thermoplasmatota archaeon]